MLHINEEVDDSSMQVNLSYIYKLFTDTDAAATKSVKVIISTFMVKL